MKQSKIRPLLLDVIYLTMNPVEGCMAHNCVDKLIKDPTKNIHRFRVASTFCEAKEMLDEKTSQTRPLFITGYRAVARDGTILDTYGLMLMAIARGGRITGNHDSPNDDYEGIVNHSTLRTRRHLISPEAFYNNLIKPALEDKVA